MAACVLDGEVLCDNVGRTVLVPISVSMDALAELAGVLVMEDVDILAVVGTDVIVSLVVTAPVT